MDRIENFQKQYITPANEAISDVGMILGGAAVMIGTLKILWHLSKKKNSTAKARSQNSYFETHEIPLEQRSAYAKKILNDVKSNFESALRQVIANKKKSGLDKVEAEIIDKIREYVTDGNRDISVKPSDVNIVYSLTDDNHGTYDMLINAEYKGNGFIPEDNVFEIAQYAFRPIVKKIVDALTKQYSEEIQCKFVEIHMDSELAGVTITAP